MIRTRFAPSPTGSLHVGNARIAVLNWLLTRREGGSFILRIEDTDAARNVAGADEEIFRDLRWLGLDWDEGPAFEGKPPPGPHGPYRQSERARVYAEFARRLQQTGAAYPCFCGAAEIEAMRRDAIRRGEPARYDGRCARLDEAARAARERDGRPHAIRFRVPAADITVHDAVRGEIRFEAGQIGDFILLRSDGRPTYNFAVVVDDIAMQITHVIRGAGHLSNTPRQLLLYHALGARSPVFAHVPMVLGPDRQKLSKRHGAKAVADYRREGYHPDALVNYLSLLSWSSESGDEFLSRDRLVREISLDRIRTSDVVFDPAKLRWLSARHIEAMPLPDLVHAVRPFLSEQSRWIPEDMLPEAVAAIRSHLSVSSEIDEQLAAFGSAAEAPVASEWTDNAKRVVASARDVLAAIASWDRPTLEQALPTISRITGARARALYEPLRIALTGRPHGPPFIALLLVQGRQRSLAALDRALRGTGRPASSEEALT